jgi:hypothetical protein
LAPSFLQVQANKQFIGFERKKKYVRLIKVSSACGGTSVREAGPEFGPQGDETVQ